MISYMLIFKNYLQSSKILITAYNVCIRLPLINHVMMKNEKFMRRLCTHHDTPINPRRGHNLPLFKHAINRSHHTAARRRTQVKISRPSANLHTYIYASRFIPIYKTIHPGATHKKATQNRKCAKNEPSQRPIIIIVVMSLACFEEGV